MRAYSKSPGCVDEIRDEDVESDDNAFLAVNEGTGANESTDVDSSMNEININEIMVLKAIGCGGVEAALGQAQRVRHVFTVIRSDHDRLPRKQTWAAAACR